MVFLNKEEIGFGDYVHNLINSIVVVIYLGPTIGS